MKKPNVGQVMPRYSAGGYVGDKFIARAAYRCKLQMGPGEGQSAPHESDMTCLRNKPLSVSSALVQSRMC